MSLTHASYDAVAVFITCKKNNAILKELGSERATLNFNCLGGSSIILFGKNTSSSIEINLNSYTIKRIFYVPKCLDCDENYLATVVL